MKDEHRIHPKVQAAHAETESMQDYLLRLIAKHKGTSEETGQPPEVRVAVYDTLLA